MLHRLPGALFLLCSSFVSLAACAAGGGNADDDGDPVDAREIDTASPDASSPDASLPDAMPPDGMVPDAMVPDAMVPLTGETCGMPEVITINGGLGNATVTGTTAGYTNHYMPPTACTSTYLQDGPDRVYEIGVPAGARLDAVVTPASSYDPSIYLVGGPATSCDANPIVCLAGTDAEYGGDAERVRYDNTTSAAVTVYVVIDGTSTIGGTYSLAVTTATIPPPTAGDLCSNAESITLTNGAGTASGSTTTANGFENDYSPPPDDCVYGRGNDRVYRVTVPAGERLAASVTASASGFDPTLYFIAGPEASCDAQPIVCLGGVDDSSGGGTEELAYENTTTDPVDVFIVVDGYSASSEGDFQLSVVVGTPPGDTCQIAETVTLTSGMATIDGTTSAGVGYRADYAPPSACTSAYTQNGNDRVHVVSVPAGTTLTATVTPLDWDASVYLVAGPATSCDANPIVCLAGIDGAGRGRAETTMYTNATGATVDVLVVVDSYSTSHAGLYSLAIGVQ